MAEAVVEVKDLNPALKGSIAMDNRVWYRTAENLIAGDGSTGFEFTFAGTREEIERGINSAIMCLNRYRSRAAKAGRFARYAFAIQRRGGTLYVYNVPLHEIQGYWTAASKYLHLPKGPQ